MISINMYFYTSTVSSSRPVTCGRCESHCSTNTSSLWRCWCWRRALAPAAACSPWQYFKSWSSDEGENIFFRGTYIRTCSTQNSISSMLMIDTLTTSAFPLYLFLHWYCCMQLHCLTDPSPVTFQMYYCYLTMSMIDLGWDGMGYIFSMTIPTVWYGTY